MEDSTLQYEALWCHIILHLPLLFAARNMPLSTTMMPLPLNTTHFVYIYICVLGPKKLEWIQRWNYISMMWWKPDLWYLAFY